MERAFINEKDVCTDWIEQVFDDCQTINNYHDAVGMIKDCVVRCVWDNYCMFWMVSRDMGGDAASALILLEQRLNEWEGDDNSNIFSIVEHTETPCQLKQRFYFKEED